MRQISNPIHRWRQDQFPVGEKNGEEKKERRKESKGVLIVLLGIIGVESSGGQLPIVEGETRKMGKLGYKWEKKVHSLRGQRVEGKREID